MCYCMTPGREDVTMVCLGARSLLIRTAFFRNDFGNWWLVRRQCRFLSTRVSTRGRVYASARMIEAQFIFFVANQEKSAAFYSKVFGDSPVLDVPGMTQFRLPGDAILGLMPAAGIKRLLGEDLPDPQSADGIPRAELYLLVDDPPACLRKAVEAGATLLSSVNPRNWGDAAGYCLDLDGHVLAFAERLKGT